MRHACSLRFGKRFMTKIQHLKTDNWFPALIQASLRIFDTNPALNKSLYLTYTYMSVWRFWFLKYYVKSWIAGNPRN